VSSLIRAVNKATWTSGLPVSPALRALAFTTSALMLDAIILIFLKNNNGLAIAAGTAANVRCAFGTACGL
jgi:hypothetical protein